MILYLAYVQPLSINSQLPVPDLCDEWSLRTWSSFEEFPLFLHAPSLLKLLSHQNWLYILAFDNDFPQQLFWTSKADVWGNLNQVEIFMPSHPIFKVVVSKYYPNISLKTWFFENPKTCHEKTTFLSTKSGKPPTKGRIEPPHALLLVGRQWFRSLGAFGTPSTRGPGNLMPTDGLTTLRGSDSREVLSAKKNQKLRCWRGTKRIAWVSWILGVYFFDENSVWFFYLKTMAASDRATSQSLYWCFWMFECLAWMGENAPCRFNNWWSSALVMGCSHHGGKRVGDEDLGNPEI